MSAARTGPPVITDLKIVAIVERASELDRVWFLRHPERAHRVRRLIPGKPLVEIASLLPPYVVVKQITPGVRIKAAFRGSRRPCDCEACASDLWLKFAPAKFQALAVEAAAIMLRRSA
jgi:hypothetical protein